MSPTRFAGARILVVEDNWDIRQLVGRFLQKRGYSVLEAEDGEAALKLIATRRPLPDLILLDLMMPIKDGYAFREAQLQDEELARIPVIVVSAAGFESEKMHALAITHFLRKPVEITDLAREIEATLEACHGGFKDGFTTESSP